MARKLEIQEQFKMEQEELKRRHLQQQEKAKLEQEKVTVINIHTYKIKRGLKQTHRKCSLAKIVSL